jgi:hypothetical protein
MWLSGSRCVCICFVGFADMRSLFSSGIDMLCFVEVTWKIDVQGSTIFDSCMGIQDHLVEIQPSFGR